MAIHLPCAFVFSVSPKLRQWREVCYFEVPSETSTEWDLGFIVGVTGWNIFSPVHPTVSITLQTFHHMCNYTKAWVMVSVTPTYPEFGAHTHSMACPLQPWRYESWSTEIISKIKSAKLSSQDHQKTTKSHMDELARTKGYKTKSSH